MKTDKTIAAQPTIAHNNRKCGLHLLWKDGLFAKGFNGSNKSQSLKTKQKQNIWYDIYERYVIDFKTTLRDSYIVWFLLQKPFNTCTLMIIPNSVVVCFNPPWLNRIIKRLCIFIFFSGWNYVLEKHGGKLPLRIRAVPEGMVIPVKNGMLGK